MKMWSLNVMILLLFCYACLSTGRGKVFFESKNFFNVLCWDPVEPDVPGQNVLYSVWNRRYGEEPNEVKHCQDISALSCNLTEETPSVYDVTYAAQVIANGKSLGSTTLFKPLADTTLGPPILWTHTSESTLSVNISLPLGPNGISIADIIARSKTGFSKIVFEYTLHLTHPEWAALVNKSTSGRFVIGLKKPGKYCGYVDYRPSFDWGREESEQTSFCVTLSTIPGNHQMHWILVGAAVVAGLIIMSIVCMCVYVKGGKPRSMPQALAAQKATQNPPQPLDDNVIISEVKLVTQSETTVYATIRIKSSVPSAGSEGYSPQDIFFHAWQDGTGSSVDTGGTSAMQNLANSSAQSSEIYSAVAVHVPEEENGDFQMPISEDSMTSDPLLSSSLKHWDNSKRSPTLMSCKAPTFPDVGSGERDPPRPLVLQTLRDINGQLMLPSLTLQFQDIIGDAASPVSPERKPLLSDLIDSKDGPLLASLQNLDTSEWSDSGCDDSTFNSPTQPYCNSNYFPTQPAGIYLQQGTQTKPESAYTPNWMYTTLHESASMESCEDTRTNCSWTEGDEEDEGNERVESSFALGKWTVHIQD